MLIVVPKLSSNVELFGLYSFCSSFILYLTYADIGFLNASTKFAAEEYAKGNATEEYKIFGYPDENAKKYVYGKLNSLYVARVGFGRKKVIIEKLREKGLQFAINWSSGASLGFVKPVYLEVFKYDLSDNPIGVSLEKYDPNIHTFYDIFGRGRWSAGLSETTINPGGYFKAGMEFDYSTEREIINSLEIGMAIDVFLLPIKLMVENNRQNIFPTMYINFSIGNKFY